MSEAQTPSFTKEMMAEYTLLMPEMAPVQFRLLKDALESSGYRRVELIGPASSPDAVNRGLQYVHNDTCYPALIIAGQFLEALDSGKYDLDHTALVISQSGGGCRASNYIKLLRKALIKAGYEKIPVVSFNVSGLEKNSSLPLSLPLILKCLAAVEYGDLLMLCANQTRPYEINSGDTDRLLESWLEKAGGMLRGNRDWLPHSYASVFRQICADFASVEVKRTDRTRVGVVGVIYVKFSPSGNNDLQKFLESQNCEVRMPGLMGYVEYCCANYYLDYQYYGMNRVKGNLAAVLLRFFDSIDRQMAKAASSYGFKGPESFLETMKKPEGILDLGTKMGEGWLLTAEMISLIQEGYPNIVCAQPFGCLPNHIAGKGVIGRIRSRWPEANITPVDYDPSAAKVNQENRLRLMISVAREKEKGIRPVNNQVY
ncbi:MAG: 2-hydroxyacyl-CoA dehydratase [Solobacterium sp.]|nr:2-hydroxyacyl-CoA dehydratase [Solobacterium sp.]